MDHLWVQEFAECIDKQRHPLMRFASAVCSTGVSVLGFCRNEPKITVSVHLKFDDLETSMANGPIVAAGSVVAGLSRRLVERTLPTSDDIPDEAPLPKPIIAPPPSE